MKPIYILLFLAFCGHPLAAQETFRIDYDIVAIFADGEWSDWQEGDNTFVFNINANGDVVHYKASGKKETYRRVMKKDEGHTASGEHYQVVTLVGEEGLEFAMQVFDNTSIGLKLIFENGLMVQMAQKGQP
jgi:hypothetical protein